MSVAKKIRDQIAANINMRALGNTTRSLRDVAVDLINASKSTIKNLAEDKTKNPQLQTGERIIKFFDGRVDLTGEVVKGPNLLQPKKK